MVRLQAPDPAGFNSGSADLHMKSKAGKIGFDGVEICWRVDSGKATARPGSAVGRESFDADKVGSEVRLRHWQPGDRFQPIGMASAVKLQDLFTNQKIPRATRRQLVLATTARGVVFWVEGMRISERFKLTRHTKHRLQWRWERL
jgi:tRNA(Ile)-lysidine synthase